MKPPCDPVVVPFIDVAHEWVAQCCPCGWSVRFADRSDAQAAADQHRQEAQL